MAPADRGPWGGKPGAQLGKMFSLARARARRGGMARAHASHAGAAWGHRTASDGPLVIAHRGASRAALENTLSAFRLAREEGADGVELDAMLSADGQVVVFHDDDLARLAGRSEHVGRLPLAALREVRLQDGTRHGEIPTLAEVLEELGPSMLVNVELKTPDARSSPDWTGRRLAVAVAAILRRHGLGARGLVSSFNPLALARFRCAAPLAQTGLLFAAEQRRPLRQGWARHVLRPTALHPQHVQVNEDALRGWRLEGYAVNVWTVDDPAELSRLSGLGVDGLITNTPWATRQVLGL